ncbi:MAG: KH domain-containing protein [Symploca sp. SIO1B1]|nr:KH domain-containing protein [Symploca sp. SIO2D2]NER22772.1 KH domain-containing protein [Symploca sp. SIO1C2]NER46232.1 KH domain-containing protein [Symploca sp. SIO1A3]NER94351.1 KH domain-containing protein [Symploca sp. SIO1B1]
MFLNKSMPNTQSTSTEEVSPNYVGLVRFLVEPFLESSTSLSIDCEKSSKARVWIRLAFEGEDKGRVFGRGGRNIQAIRTVIKAVAQAAGQSVHLDIYDDSDGAHPKENSKEKNFGGRVDVKRRVRPRPSLPKPAPKLRSQ